MAQRKPMFWIRSFQISFQRIKFRYHQELHEIDMRKQWWSQQSQILFKCIPSPVYHENQADSVNNK